MEMIFRKSSFIYLAFFLIFIHNTAEANVKDKSILRKNEEIWRLGQQYLSVIREPNTGLLYSGRCTNRKCEAFHGHKAKLRGKNINEFKPSTNSGGKNPGAIICKDLLGETVVYLKNLQGNENSFCSFSDHSFISTSSLVKMISIAANGNIQIKTLDLK